MSNEEEKPFDEKFLASIRPEYELRRMLIDGDKAKALIKHEEELRRPVYSVLTLDGNAEPKFYGVLPFPDIVSYEGVAVRETFDGLAVVEDELGKKTWNERNYIEAVETGQIVPSMEDVAYGRRRLMPVKGKPEIKCVRPLPSGRIKYRTKPSSRKWEIMHSDGKREKVDKRPDDVLYWDIEPTFLYCLNQHGKTQHSEVCKNILRNAVEVKLGMFDGLARELIDMDLVDDSSGALELTELGYHQLVKYLNEWWRCTPYKGLYIEKLSEKNPDLLEVMRKGVVETEGSRQISRASPKKQPQRNYKR